MSDISKNIKRLRQEKGLTQDELAEKLHVTRQAVSNWENDKNHPDIELLMGMAELFGVDIKEILYEPEPVRVRRRKIAVAAIFWALTAIAFVSYPTLFRSAQEWMRATFIPTGTWLCYYILRPLRLFLLGVSFPATLAIWVKPTSGKKNLRALALITGTVFIVGYGVLYAMYFPFRCSSFLGLSSHWFYYFATEWDWLFLIPGALLFLGWPRKAG